MDIENRENLEHFFKTLELEPNASFSEIKSSYFHLKRLYSSASPVLSTMMDDVSEEKRQTLLQKIEIAFQELKQHFSTVETEKQKNTADRVAKKNIPEFEVFSGNALKLTREVLGVELQEIALSTGIPLRHLQNIENERPELLPPLGYVRIYVSRYAEYLSLDPRRVSEDYIKALEKKQHGFSRNRY